MLWAFMQEILISVGLSLILRFPVGFPQSTDKCRDGTSLYVVCSSISLPTQHSISHPFDIWQHLYMKYLSVSLNEFSDLLFLVLYLSLVMIFIYCHYRCDVFLAKLITSGELHISHIQFIELSVCVCMYTKVVFMQSATCLDFIKVIFHDFHKFENSQSFCS